MKPERPTNGVNSAMSHKISSREGCSINDSKTNNEELDGFSSEFLTKINNFFEIHNSFLYEDVHENTNDLEKYLSTDANTDLKVNGNCSNEDKIVEDEKSFSDESQKLYSSKKTYDFRDVKESPDLSSEGGSINIQSAKKNLGNPHLSPFEIVKIPSIPDSFQLPVSNETLNTVTFDVFSSENNFIDIKFPTCNSSSLSRDLTKAQRSVRLNKKSNLKKIIKKSTNEKLTVPYKTKECLSPKEIISRDVAEKSKLENVTPVHLNLEINSSLDDLSENEEEKEYQRLIQETYERYPLVTLVDIFKMQFNNENESSCVEKFQKQLQSEVKTTNEKNIGKTSKKVLNSGKNLKKNKALSSEAKNSLNETNDSVKAKGKTFTPDQNLFFAPTKLSKKSNNVAEENLLKKSKLRISNNSAKEVAEEVPLKKKDASRKKSVQNISKIEAKFDKKGTSRKKTALEKEDILNENNVEDTDLPINEVQSDLINNKITANKNLTTKIKTKKNAPKKKGALENEDILYGNNIIVDAALHAKSRNNLCKVDVVTADKSLNAKIEIKKSKRKKRAALENNEDILYGNKIVGNTNLTINEIKKGLMKNKIVAADKHLDTKPNKKNTAKKKTSLKKEDILNKNNIAENTNLPVNEIGTDLVENKTVVDDQNQKSKSMQLYKTITPVSQNSSMKNMFDCLNKNTSSIALSETPQRNSSSFMQLFHKVMESNNSGTFSKSNNPFAKLFDQRSSLKYVGISKITKELNQKQDEEQLLQPNSPKDTISLANLKSSKAAKENSVKITPSGGKRSNEDDTEVTPLKKKKQNQDPVKRNSEKNLDGEISSNDDSDEHFNDKITKTAKKQLVQSIVSKPSRRCSKRNKKLVEESNVTSDLGNPQKSKSVKKIVAGVTSLAKSHSSCNSASDIQTPRRSSRTKNSTTVKSVDAQSPHKTKGKTAALLFAESESLYNDEKFDACSLIKVVEVKSLANLNKKKNTNLRSKKSNSSDSFSENSKAIESSEKQLQPIVSDTGKKNGRKNKHLHLSHNESSCAKQSDKNPPIELNSADGLTRTKRKRRSTSVDPNFCYEVKTQRIKKEDKSFPIHNNGTESPIAKKSPSKLMRSKETDFVNEMSANTTQEVNANEHPVQICNNGDQVCNLNSNGVPMTSLNSEQFRDFLSSYILYPLNSSQCHILYSAELNSPLLAVPVQYPLNLPALMPSVITNNDNKSGAPLQAQSYPLQNFPISPFISSTQASVLSTRTIKTTCVHEVNPPHATPAVSGQNVSSELAPQTVPSIIATQNVSSELAPQTVPSIIATQNVSLELAPQTVPSVIATQNVPLFTTNKNILSELKPQTISSAVNSGNVPVTSSNEISCNSYSNNLVNNVHPVEISPSKTTWSAESLQTPPVLQKRESELCICWESVLERSFALIDISFIDKLSESTFGKKLDDFTVEEFYTNPIVVKELSKQLKGATIQNDSKKIDYYFDDSILDEPFTYVLRNVVYFFMLRIPEKALEKTGYELKMLFFHYIYSNFSVLASMLFAKLMPPKIVKDLTFDKAAGLVCLVSVIYIFFHCRKYINKNMLPCSSDLTPLF